MIRHIFQLASNVARAIRSRVVFYRRYGVALQWHCFRAARRIVGHVGAHAGGDLIRHAKALMHDNLGGPTMYRDLLNLAASLSEPVRGLTVEAVKASMTRYAARRHARNLARMAEAFAANGNKALSSKAYMDLLEDRDDPANPVPRVTRIESI